MTIATQAFLFDADAEGVPSYYGGVFDPAFLQALSGSDPDGTTITRILRGDLPVSWLCQRTVAVANDGKGQSSTIGHDMELYRTVIWDLADAFAGQWNTLNLETFPITLARKNVYCITATPMKIGGYPVEMEGLCGWANVRIPDARRGFGRWVVRSGAGHRHHRSGAAIYASHDSQSFDRAVAYANAFAAVLKLNGLECEVESRLD